MKKLFLLMLALLPVVAMAKGDDSKYLKGAVPEENGQVVFTKAFTVQGMNDAEILKNITAWAEKLVEESIPAPGNFARVMGSEDQSITVRVCQWLVFKNKPLYLDRARLRYQLTASVKDGLVTLRLSQLRYYYGENEDLAKNADIRAEEWITDAEALNKAGTKLYPKSGKFRRKTVDYVQQLVENCADACEKKVVQLQTTEMKRPHIKMQ
ncbi:MAG: DUF4468 domain-containing protein [Bacteroidaceae bacterium]|nr:DUF4468 domain-containing protein [Bacteroidaceae bacterium]